MIQIFNVQCSVLETTLIGPIMRELCVPLFIYLQFVQINKQ